MKTNISVKEDFDGITVRIQIPRDDLFLFEENQIQMLHLADKNPGVDQLRIIFTMMLDVLSKRRNNG